MSDTVAPEQPVGQLTYSPREVARLLGVSRSSVYELISEGRLPARKLGARMLIRHDALVAFVDGLPEHEAAR